MADVKQDEKTFALIKPDAVRANKANEIMQIIEMNGFSIVMQQKIQLTRPRAEEFYAEHKGKEFFEKLVDFMTSGPVYAMVLSKPGAILAWRALMGPTNVFKAREDAPQSLRALFGTDGTQNACHGSDSPMSAAREIRFYFPQFNQERMADVKEDEKTFALIKPDAVRANKANEIMQIIEMNGFSIVMQQKMQLTRPRAEEFYGEHKGKEFFEKLVNFMTSGPVYAMILSKPGAILAWRALMGPTNVFKAREDAPRSLRALYGTDGTQNACHGSDSPISAAREIRFYFPQFIQEPLMDSEAAKTYIEQMLQPTLVKALTALAREKPSAEGFEALTYLAKYLLNNNPNKPRIVAPDQWVEDIAVEDVDIEAEFAEAEAKLAAKRAAELDSVVPVAPAPAPVPASVVDHASYARQTSQSTVLRHVPLPSDPMPTWEPPAPAAIIYPAEDADGGRLDETSVDEAATMLQAAYRGYTSRKSAESQRADKAQEGEMFQEEEAPVAQSSRPTSAREANPFPDYREQYGSMKSSASMQRGSGRYVNEQTAEAELVMPKEDAQYPGSGRPSQSGQDLGLGRPSESGPRMGSGRPSESGPQLGSIIPSESGLRPGSGQTSQSGQRPGSGHPSEPGLRSGSGHLGSGRPSETGRPGSMRLSQSGPPEPGQPDSMHPSESGRPASLRPSLSGSPEPGQSELMRPSESGRPGSGQRGSMRPSESGRPGSGQPGSMHPSESGRPGSGQPGSMRPSESGRPGSGQPGSMRPSESGRPGSGQAASMRPSESGRPGSMRPSESGQEEFVRPSDSGHPGSVQPGSGHPSESGRPGSGRPTSARPTSARPPSAREEHSSRGAVMESHGSMGSHRQLTTPGSFVANAEHETPPVENTEEMEAAATKVQAAFRGHQARKEVRGMKAQATEGGEGEVELEEPKMEAEAVIEQALEAEIKELQAEAMAGEDALEAEKEPKEEWREEVEEKAGLEAVAETKIESQNEDLEKFEMMEEEREAEIEQKMEELTEEIKEAQETIEELKEEAEEKAEAGEDVAALEEAIAEAQAEVEELKEAKAEVAESELEHDRSAVVDDLAQEGQPEDAEALAPVEEGEKSEGLEEADAAAEPAEESAEVIQEAAEEAAVEEAKEEEAWKAQEEAEAVQEETAKEEVQEQYRAPEEAVVTQEEAEEAAEPEATQEEAHTVEGAREEAETQEENEAVQKAEDEAEAAEEQAWGGGGDILQQEREEIEGVEQDQPEQQEAVTEEGQEEQTEVTGEED